jgi:hypothetical protein
VISSSSFEFTFSVFHVPSNEQKGMTDDDSTLLTINITKNQINIFTQPFCVKMRNLYIMGQKVLRKIGGVGFWD